MNVNKEIKIPGFSNRVKMTEVAVCTRQLATMIDSGLSVVRSLGILAGQVENKELAKVLNEVRVDVERGSALSAAVARHPKIFNTLFVTMVQAGEAGGHLDTVLLDLSSTMEKQAVLRRKVRSAMTYPAVVLSVMVRHLPGAARLHRAGVPEAVHLAQRQVAHADADGDRRLQDRPERLVGAARRHAGGGHRRSSVAGSRPRTDGSSGTVSSSSPPSSDSSSTRWPWRASPTRWRRSSRRASPSWSRWTSSRIQRATASWATPCSMPRRGCEKDERWPTRCATTRK